MLILYAFYIMSILDNLNQRQAYSRNIHGEKADSVGEFFFSLKADHFFSSGIGCLHGYPLLSAIAWISSNSGYRKRLRKIEAKPRGNSTNCILDFRFTGKPLFYWPHYHTSKQLRERPREKERVCMSLRMSVHPHRFVMLRLVLPRRRWRWISRLGRPHLIS